MFSQLRVLSRRDTEHPQVTKEPRKTHGEPLHRSIGGETGLAMKNGLPLTDA